MYANKFVVNHINHRKGEFVFKQGEAPAGFYIVKSGEVKVTVQVSQFKYDLLLLERGSLLHQLDLFQEEGVRHEYSALCC